MPTELTSDPRGVSLISGIRGMAPPGASPKLPHRLDRVTRGLVLVTLTDEAIAFHNERLRAGDWTKLYLARCHAPAEGPAGDLLGIHKAYLKRERHRARVVHSGGKPSFLEVLAIAPAPDREGEIHVLIRLMTGRFHQIRAMLANLGMPLVGDRFYGGEGTWDDLYLEHLALRYVEAGTGCPTVAHWKDDPDREPVAAEMQEAIAERIVRLAEPSAADPGAAP